MKSFSILNEEELIGALALGGLLFGLILTALETNRQSKQIERSLIDNYIDDFLTVNIKWKDNIKPNVNFFGEMFLRRKRLFSLFLKKENLTIVPSHDIAKVLKTYLSNFEPFSKLNTKWSKEYSKSELENLLDKNFSIFGNFRSDTAITWDGILKNIVTLGFSKQIPNLDNQQITDILYYIALVFRQLLLNIDMIENITFTTKEVNITHTKLI